MMNESAGSQDPGPPAMAIDPFIYDALPSRVLFGTNTLASLSDEITRMEHGGRWFCAHHIGGPTSRP